MRGILVGAAVGAVALGAAIACSSFESDTPTTGGTDAAADSAAPADGASPDGMGVPDDGAALDGAALSPCVGAEHYLCADFDEPPFYTGWSEYSVDGGSSLALDQTPMRWVSPPSSLRASIPDASGVVEALLAKKIPYNALTIDLSFALRIAFTGGHTAAVAILELGTSTGGEGLFLTMNGNDLEATMQLVEVHHPQDGGATQYVYHSIPLQFTIAKWYALAIHVSALGGGSGQVALSVNGAQQVAFPTVFNASTVGARVSVGVVHFSNIYPAHEVHIDDVVIDTTQ